MKQRTSPLSNAPGSSIAHANRRVAEDVAVGKYQLLAATIRTARELTRTGLRLRFPDDSASQIEAKLARIWLNARP